VIERVEELLLGCCHGLGVESGDLGRGLGLLGGALGLGGKVGAVAGGVGVALGDGGGNATGAGRCGGCGRECEGWLRLIAPAAMSGEAFGNLVVEGFGGGRRSGAGRGVGGLGGGIAGRFRIQLAGIKQCGTHIAQNSNSLP
jgi:hypothetical protein